MSGSCAVDPRPAVTDKVKQLPEQPQREGDPN